MKSTPISKELIQGILKLRKPYSHKGDYGHALLIAGSEGKYGASVIAANACLRCGVGLLTVHIPKNAEEILQSTLPEAMVELDKSESHFTAIASDVNNYTTIGIGPGLGLQLDTQKVFKELLELYRKPIVIDADGLNILALHSEWESLIPPHSILTPHPKEFERLAGIWSTEEECAGKLINFSRILDCILILKGHETKIACPDGKLFVNTTGNPGMAKGGSGDALTGIITAFLAQGYTSEEASLLGVYLHGLAGDIAAERTSEFSMLPSDLIDSLSEAFRRLL